MKEYTRAPTVPHSDRKGLPSPDRLAVIRGVVVNPALSDSIPFNFMFLKKKRERKKKRRRRGKEKGVSAGAMERLDCVQEGRLRARVVRVARARVHRNCNCNPSPLHLFRRKRHTGTTFDFLRAAIMSRKKLHTCDPPSEGWGVPVAAATRTNRPNEADGSCDKAVCLLLANGW